MAPEQAAGRPVSRRHRHLRAGCGHLLLPHRQSPVHRRQPAPGRRATPGRRTTRAAARHPGGGPGPGVPGPGQGPARPVQQRRGDGRGRPDRGHRRRAADGDGSGGPRCATPARAPAPTCRPARRWRVGRRPGVSVGEARWSVRRRPCWSRWSGSVPHWARRATPAMMTRRSICRPPHRRCGRAGRWTCRPRTSRSPPATRADPIGARSPTPPRRPRSPPRRASSRARRPPRRPPAPTVTTAPPSDPPKTAYAEQPATRDRSAPHHEPTDRAGGPGGRLTAPVPPAPISPKRTYVAEDASRLSAGHFHHLPQEPG